MKENEPEASKLETQILEKGKEVHTQSYSMSIGEVKNLYEEGDLDLYPEFQRFFRWEDEKKYRLIESILLGIPLPSFFVYQRREDGVWDVVDGLQRLSTIFEFMGVLKDESKNILPPLVMDGTKYLPLLKDMSWNNEDPNFEISESIKRDFKRRKLDFNIILKQSDESTKYELFDRLNTGGSNATSQEVRNGILIRENRAVYKLMDELSKSDNFINTTTLSDGNLEERFDLELISRFFILKNVDLGVLGSTTASEYLTEELIKKAQMKDFNWDKEVTDFEQTFEIINSKLSSDAFKKYNTKKQKFEGGFVVSAFEAIALGIGKNPNNIDPNKVNENVINFWKAKESGTLKWAGRNTTSRLQITISTGRKLFQL